MIQKEEDTLVLLTPVEEDDSKKEGNYSTRRSYSVSGLSSSFLCGAGIFIANIVLWCRDSEEGCKESEVFRVTSMLGGIISSLIVGRAVDFYGRQSSLMFSVLFWFFATVFMLFLPSQTHKNVNYYDAPLSEYYIWHSETRPSSDDYPPSFTVSTYDTEVSVPHVFSYSYFHNSSFENHVFPTKPTLIKSVSIQSYRSPLSVAPLESDSGSDKSFSLSKNKMSEFSRLKAVNTIKKHSILIPLLTFHLFLGAASAASIVAVSIYIFETSPTNSRACWMSLSDFFSSLLILSLPVIQGHLMLLAICTWLPMIALGLLKIIPTQIPDYLSLPHSPHFLLLSMFMHKRNSLLSNSAALISNEGKEGAPTNVDGDKKQFRTIFETCSNATLGYIKIPFKKAKIKVYDSSSKLSACDDDGSCTFNDKLKHVVLETNCEHFQSVTEENEADPNSIHDLQSEMDFSVEIDDYLSANIVENISNGGKQFVWETKSFDNLGETFNLNKNVVGEYEDEGCGTAFPESNDTCNAGDMQEESTTLIQDGWQDSNTMAVSWQEKESLRILSYLNGNNEGFLEWKKINKMLKDDVPTMKFSSKNTFFHCDIVSFGSTLQLVFKVGLPLIIIHMFSCEYGAVVILSETLFPKLGFCNLSGPAIITSLQVMSSGTSILVLDKLRNQMVLNCAAVIMTSSIIILWFLLPSVGETNAGELLYISRSSSTQNPMLPTLYPLLPTPLPQVLKGQDHLCSRNQFENFPSQSWDNMENVLNRKKQISLNSPSIWFSTLVLMMYVVASSLVLLPLTRLMMVSYFPIHKRGTCVGLIFAMEWILRLVMIFFPWSFFNSNMGFSLCIGALLSSILSLCVTSHDLSSKDKFFQSDHKNKNISLLSSHRKISNMSEINSTAV